MDRALIDREHLVDRYVRGSLDEHTRTAFEIYMLEHPQLAEEVEYAAAMRTAIRKAGSDVSPHTRLAAWSVPVRIAVPVAMAATVLLTFGAIGYWQLMMENQALSGIRTTLSGMHELGPDVVLESTRSGDARRVVRADGSPIILSIDTADLPIGSYRIEVTRGEDEQSLASMDFHVDSEMPRFRFLLPAMPDGSVTVDVFSGVETVRTYELSLHAAAPDP